MQIKSAELASFAKDSLTLCLIQLESPFDGILDKTWSFKGHVFSVIKENEDKYKTRISRLSGILDYLQRMERRIDVIVLPEYAFLKNDAPIAPDNLDTLTRLERYSEASRTIVIGNHYNTDERRNESFVIVPSGYVGSTQSSIQGPLILSARKFTASRYDSDTLAPTDSPEDAVIRLEWRSQTDPERSAYLQILTCKDYLYFTSIKPLREYPDMIRLETPGIIICPMATPEIHSFETRAMAMIRDVDATHGDLSVITCLCNGTSLSQSLGSTLCGQSQVISPLDLRTQIKPMIHKGAEGCVLVEVNPFRSYRTPTPINTRDAGSVILWSEVLHVTSTSGEPVSMVSASGSRLRSRIVINPEYMHFIGLRRVYGFLRSQNYNEFKRIAHKKHGKHPLSSVSLHGIYGIHDVLAGSWEEFSSDENARNFMKMRLWPMVSENGQELDNAHFGCCIVKRFWKYRGVRLGGTGKSPHLEEYMREPHYRRRLKAVLTGQANDVSFVSELAASGVSLETHYDGSDISIEEANVGFMEYLVLIKLIVSDAPPHVTGARHEFERTTLERLLADDRVRTIEEIQSEGSGYVDADYIVHIVGDLGDLNDIVLGVIHASVDKPDEPRRLSCGSRVVIRAESITPDNCPALDEMNKLPATEPNVIEFVKAWKKIEMDDRDARVDVLLSSIFNIDEESMRKLMQCYFLADRVSLKERKDPSWMRDFFEYAYGICCAIGASREYEQWIRLCNSFVTTLGREVEAEVGHMAGFLCKAIKLPEEALEALANAAIEVMTEKTGKFTLNSIELGAFAFALEKMTNVIQKESNKARTLDFILAQGDKLRISRDQAEAALAALESVVAAGKIPLSDIVREMNGFAKARNAVVHYHQVKGEFLLEGTFFGLRFLDRCAKVPHRSLADRYAPRRDRDALD